MAKPKRTLEDWAALGHAKYAGRYQYTGMFTHKNKPTLQVVCPDHGTFDMDASGHISSNRGCPRCGTAARGTSQQMTYEDFLSRALKVHGDLYQYKGMTEGTKNSRSCVTVVCPVHGEFTQNRGHHLRGHGCAACGFDATGDRSRYTLERWVEKFRAVHGAAYTYPATFNLGAKSRITIQCPTHGAFEQALVRHSAGDGCPGCGMDVVAGSLRLNFTKAVNSAQAIHRDKYLYLRLHWANQDAYFDYTCPKHGWNTQGVKTHLKGHGCRQCSIESRAEGRRYTFEDVQARAVETHGNKYVYKSLKPSTPESLAKVLAVCPTHGEFYQNVTGHLRGDACPDCGTRISKGQRQVFEHVQSLGLEPVLEHCIDLGTRKVYADIFVPEANLVVEYLGIHWHSSRLKEDRHLQKRQDALEALGYKFLAIFEDEWAYRRKAVESLLAVRCGQVSERVAARKCSLVSVALRDAKAFMEDHHVQGYASSAGESVGLAFEGELVAVMIFNSNTSDRSRVASLVRWELVRYATARQVVGGASRLLRAFIRQHPEARTIVSFSDRRMFSGGMYAQLGFRLDHRSAPDYSYVVGRRRRHKRGYQKSALALLYPNADLSLTEREIAAQQGLHRIYDSGKFRWVLDL